MVLDQNLDFGSFSLSGTFPPSKPATASFLNLPAELQIQIMQHFGYKTLKQLQRTCKLIKAVLENTVFDRMLFRRIAEPLSKDELRRLWKETSAGRKGSNVELHPLMHFGSLKLDYRTKVLCEMATNPPVGDMLLQMDDVEHLVHKILPIRIADIISSKFTLCRRKLWQSSHARSYQTTADEQRWVKSMCAVLALSEVGVTEEGLLVLRYERDDSSRRNNYTSRRFKGYQVLQRFPL